MAYDFDERDLQEILRTVKRTKGWVVFLGVCQIIMLVFWLLVFIAGMTSPMYY